MWALTRSWWAGYIYIGWHAPWPAISWLGGTMFSQHFWRKLKVSLEGIIRWMVWWQNLDVLHELTFCAHVIFATPMLHLRQKLIRDSMHRLDAVWTFVPLQQATFVLRVLQNPRRCAFILASCVPILQVRLAMFHMEFVFFRIIVHCLAASRPS